MVVVTAMGLAGALVAAEPAAAAASTTLTISKRYGLTALLDVTTSSAPTSGKIRITAVGGPDSETLVYDDVPHSGTFTRQLVEVNKPGSWTFKVDSPDGSIEQSAPVTVTVDDWRPTFVQNPDRSLTATFPPPNTTNDDGTKFVVIFGLTDSTGNGPFGYVPDTFGKSEQHVTIAASDMAFGVVYDVHLRYEIAIYPYWGRDQPNIVPAKYRIVPKVSRSYGAPQNLVATPRDTSVDLSWTAPTDPPPSNLSYRAEYRAVGASNWNSVLVSGLNCSFTGLTNGVDYEFRVFTMQGSTAHLPTAAVTSRPITAPLAPTISAVQPIDSALVVSAAFPTSAAAPSDPAAGIWEVAPHGTQNWTAVTPSSSAPYTLGGLVNGTDYDVRVRSVNTSGTGQSAAQGPTRPVAVPATPILGSPQRSVNSFALTATYPSATASPVVSTEWQRGPVISGAVAAGDWTTVLPSSSSGLYSFTSGLTAGSDYRVRTRSVNATGPGPWAESPTIRVIDLPSTPVIRSVTAGDRSLTVDADLGATDAHPSDPARALWQISSDGGATWASASPTLVGGFWEFGQLTNGTPYSFRATGVNDVGSSSSSARSANATPVAAPSTPSFGPITIGDASGSAAFTQPSTAEAPAVSAEFRLREWTSSNVSNIVAGNVPAMSNGTVTASGLVNGHVYQLEGRSINGTGASVWSGSSRFTPLAAPSAPVLGTPTPVDGGVTISMTLAGGADQTANPDNTVWEVATAASNSWHSVTAVEVSPGVFRIDQLSNGMPYRVRVTPVNATGPGTAATSSVVTPVAAPASPTITSVADGDGSLTVSATVPSSAAAPAQTLTFEVATIAFSGRSAGDLASAGPRSAGLLRDPASETEPSGGWTQSRGPWVATTAVLSGGSYVISGLTNGTTYQVRLTSSNTSGSNAPSISDNATPFGAPRTPEFRAAGPQDAALIAALNSSATRAAPVSDLEWEVATVFGSKAGLWQPVTTEGPGQVTLGSGSGAVTVGNAFTVRGLINGVEYQVRTRAHNAHGASPWAAWSSTVTPSASSRTGEIPDPTNTNPNPNPNPNNPDTDDDGVPNSDDPDTDGDGIPNSIDPDVDGDGIANVFDTDVDGDGEPNTSDADADADRFPNAQDSTPNGIGTLADIDGDGIPNAQDPDMDGDGTANVYDPDIDGDGIPNATDPTPAGPDSGPGDTGTGSAGDIDGDGIPNASDPDVDGDGIANVFDPDVDGDGIPNASDPDVDADGTANAQDSTPNGIGTLADIDGDGIPNAQDPDMDGDGTANVYDPDIDGDGIPNAEDPTPAGPGSVSLDTGTGTLADIDGDGIPNATDPDVDGDGIANVFDGDVDGDGILNASDPDADADRLPNASDSTPNGIGSLPDIDGDGIPNGTDPDMDGDGVANVSDPDIDGDGIPNAQDPTPAGPGSQPGDTGPGTLADIDGDGVPNATDPDVDGDGIANVFDGDVDGDGVPNATDPDIDGDGTANASDSTPNGIGTLADIDGDGIPNAQDPDMDGDGIVNVLDPDIDGDGIPNHSDPTPAGPGSAPGDSGPGRVGDIDGDGIPDQIDDDIDGDGIPNGSDPDVDGDGIPNGSDPDVDGDGVLNGADPDVDGDGIPNGQDSDVDGDGIPNGSDSDVDGDGVLNGSDPDIDGDGLPNATDPDVDGDGIVNFYDGDVDGDGIPNGSDPDADADGVTNASDPTPYGIGTEGDLDGDGTPNESDPDMDGDGRNNSADDDIDGDGIPNGSDSTPAGPGSQSGDTGTGTQTDTDGDGIPNGLDPDVDGDGIPNGQDPDVDGDGIPNGQDPDVDGDGVPNGRDPDVDGDGIPNGSDPDIDGDGVANVFDPDVDGDGIPNASDPDIDGDGIPNGVDGTPRGIGTLDDIDGDGIPNAQDPDVDGDGIPNAQDPDVDGDGIPNAQDPDADGDGIPNGSDSTPRGVDRLPTTASTTNGSGGAAGSREPRPGLGSVASASSSAASAAAALLNGEGGASTTSIQVDSAANRSDSEDSSAAVPHMDGVVSPELTAAAGGFLVLLLLGGAFLVRGMRRRAS